MKTITQDVTPLHIAHQYKATLASRPIKFFSIPVCEKIGEIILHRPIWSDLTRPLCYQIFDSNYCRDIRVNLKTIKIWAVASFSLSILPDANTIYSRSTYIHSDFRNQKLSYLMQDIKHWIGRVHEVDRMIATVSHENLNQIQSLRRSGWQMVHRNTETGLWVYDFPESNDNRQWEFMKT